MVDYCGLAERRFTAFFDNTPPRLELFFDDRPLFYRVQYTRKRLHFDTFIIGWRGRALADHSKRLFFIFLFFLLYDLQFCVILV